MKLLENHQNEDVTELAVDDLGAIAGGILYILRDHPVPPPDLGATGITGCTGPGRTLFPNVMGD